ncbi:hypothetical protein CIG11343_0405 [Campylobacter iguaniorum]|uniref:Lipoprotein n=1 Tax=Campylobacter iguaniorum TaxID=1244531 RepID=A0A076F807_9BACT|nr:hypothetical protein [Campylobacter iguaniorum]AII14320.1 hypothetical protein CIG1485E_0454 [Campylobacter iguaniorum]ALV24055.1 hypothetical protein CIG2463D_0455 [Campylobacter iguaniorum]ANE35487.1 hypothetical protein CIG11343_0405 [Campylobacter iguaniorum]
MFKHSFLLLVAFIFAGCSLFERAPQPAKSKPALAKPAPKYIKGTIQKVSRDTNGFKYEIKGTDLSNFKLKWAVGVSDQSDLKVGDLVYGELSGAKFTYIALIIQNYASPEKHAYTPPTHKRDKSKKVKIALPQEEKLNF